MNFLRHKKDTDNTKIVCPAVSILYLLAGLYGGLFYFQSLSGISYHSGLVYSAAAILCSLLWYLHFYQRRLFDIIFCSIVCLCVLVSILLHNTIQPQLSYIADRIFGIAALEDMEITEAALLLMVIFCSFLFFMEFMMSEHAFLYFLFTAILFLAPWYGIRVGIGAIVLLLVFLIFSRTLHKTGSANEILSISGAEGTFFLRKSILSDQVKHRLSQKSIRITARIGAVCLVIALTVTILFGQGLFQIVYDVEGYVYRSWQQLSGKENQLVTDGKMNKGNLYYTGAKHLKVKTSRQPKEKLYLRGFSGGDYLGNDWAGSKDENLFTNMEEELQWAGWSYMIRSMYHSMYFVMNSKMQGGQSPEPMMMTVERFDKKYDNSYVPYYSRLNRNYDKNGYGSDGYLFYFYEQQDMNIVWENVPPEFEGMRDYYQKLQWAYKQEALEAYTKVPQKRVPSLVQFTTEHPLEDLDEITAFILYTLQNNATYSVMPGQAPKNRDLVEYFLFENGRGYCQHFAAAATLMYRLYGIPARYATGYVVLPSEFEQQEDGSWHAHLTDESAHAWTEIFLENYGWTPVEVTPATDGSVAVNYPGFDNVKFLQLLSEHKWNKKTVQLSKDNSNLTVSESMDLSLLEIDFHKYQKQLWILGTCIVYSVLLMPFFLDYRRLRRLKKMDDMNCRQVFAKFLVMLHETNYLSNCDGTEEDFAKKLCTELPVLSEKEAQRMLDIVSRAAYSSKKPTEEEENYVRIFYFKTANVIYQKMKWQKKLWFRYRRAQI